MGLEECGHFKISRITGLPTPEQCAVILILTPTFPKVYNRLKVTELCRTTVKHLEGT